MVSYVSEQLKVCKIKIVSLAKTKFESRIQFSTSRVKLVDKKVHQVER